MHIDRVSTHGDQPTAFRRTINLDEHLANLELFVRVIWLLPRFPQAFPLRNLHLQASGQIVDNTERQHRYTQSFTLPQRLPDYVLNIHQIPFLVILEHTGASSKTRPHPGS